MSERLAQRVSVVAMIDPMGILASSTTTCDVIDAKLYDSLMFILALGAITSSGQVTMTVYKGASATATKITSSITAADRLEVSTGATDADKQQIIDVDVSKEGKRYYLAQIVANGETTTGGAFASMVVLGSKPRYHPASDNDLASVDQIILA
jgi:hypothetical protein